MMFTDDEQLSGVMVGRRPCRWSPRHWLPFAATPSKKYDATFESTMVLLSKAPKWVVLSAKALDSHLIHLKLKV
jgi:hypothetical protein